MVIGLSNIESGKVDHSGCAFLPVEVDGMARSVLSSRLEVLAKAKSLSLVVAFFLGGDGEGEVEME